MEILVVIVYPATLALVRLVVNVNPDTSHHHQMLHLHVHNVHLVLIHHLLSVKCVIYVVLEQSLYQQEHQHVFNAQMDIIHQDLV